MTAQLETALRGQCPVELRCLLVLTFLQKLSPESLAAASPPPPLDRCLDPCETDKSRERLVGYSHIWQEAPIQVVQEKIGIWCLAENRFGVDPQRTDVLLVKSRIPWARWGLQGSLTPEEDLGT